MSIEIQKSKLELDNTYNDSINEVNEDDNILLAIQKNRTIKYNNVNQNQAITINKTNNNITPVQNNQPISPAQQRNQPILPKRNQNIGIGIVKKNEKINEKEKSMDKTKPIEKEVKVQAATNSFNINDFIKVPLWQQLVELVKKNPSNNNNITKNIVLLFVNYPLNYYQLIYYFVCYSEEVSKKLELKGMLIKAMIEILNNYIKLYNNRQLIWNNKNVVIAVKLMSSWNLDKLTNNTSK